MTVYFREKPAIAFPAWLRALDFEDHSYGNDFAACAQFKRPDGFVISVWCAESRLKQREDSDMVRFRVRLADSEDDLDGFGEQCDEYAGEDWQQARSIARALQAFTFPDVAHLAAVFSDGIRAALTPKQLERVNHLNHPSRRKEGTCASQDVIDANQVMIDALERCSGYNESVLAASRRWTDLINGAWALARESGFSLTAKQ